jgi:hypothetical protein
MSVYKPNGTVSRRSSKCANSSFTGSAFRNPLHNQQDYSKGIREAAEGELERAAAGLPTDQKATRIRTVADVIKSYLGGYKLNHRPQSVIFATGRLAVVQKDLGNVVLSDLTEERIRAYIRQRQAENISGRTINMELGELSRAIGHPWSLLWPKTRKLEERKDIGQALSPNAQRALLDGLQDVHSPPTYER